MSKKQSYFIFIFLLLGTIWFGYSLKYLHFNYVFESFFPTDDTDLAYYHEFEELFETDNDYLLIGLVNQPSVFDSSFLSQLDSLTILLSHSSKVSTVTSLTSIKKPVISPTGYFEVPIIHPKNPQRYAADSTRIFKADWLVGSGISSDATAIAIIVKHQPMSGKEEADSLVSNIRSTIDAFSFQKVHLVGKIHAQGVFVDKMQDELIIFLSASVILVIVFLAIAFRTWWGIIIPLMVVMLSTLWILGIMGMTGKSLDILMVLLPTIMFIVGMSDVVHIITKYIEQLRLGNTKKAAISVTVREIGMATFLTSLTTAVGFLTLVTASIRPIQEFGIYTAMGVFIAFIVAFTLLPACLVLLPKPKISEKLVHKAAWAGFLSRSFITVMRNKGWVIALNIILIGVSFYGISQIVINTYLIEDLPQDDPLKHDFAFFDRELGGSRPFEITATVQYDTVSIFDQQVLREINKVQHYLKADFEAGHVISPVTVVKGLNQALHGGVSTAYHLPDSHAQWKRVNKYLRKILKRDFTKHITANGHRTGRISARVGDIGSALSLKRTENLKDFITNKTDSSLVKFRVTGTSNLIDKNNQYLAKNMFQGLGIAFLAVAMIAGLLFRSFRMILITLIPNIIPLLIVGGIMGLFGITLKLSTSIIFTIAFGIAVDDTIHFTSKLKIELSKGKSLLYALKRTYLSTGKAIIVTSIILSGGFIILMLSSFGGTYYTGLLVSLTLIFALIIDLSLLPVLVILFYRKKAFKKFK